MADRAALDAMLAELPTDRSRSWPLSVEIHRGEARPVAALCLRLRCRRAGRDFPDRVLELRLQAAFAVLQDPDRATLRVSEVARPPSIGLHFNRCFRRRFGMTPTNVRAAARSATNGSGLSHQML